MRAALLVAVVVGGCGRLGFDRVYVGSGGDGGDATGDGGGSGTCAMPATSDGFAAGGNICGTWGVPTNMTDSSRQNGLDVIVPPNHNNYVANCTDTALAFAAGTFVSVSQVTTLGTGFSQLSVYTSGGNLATIDYYVDTDELEYGDDSSRSTFGRVAYDPVAMRWWRMYPSSTHEITGQYSSDGLTWTTIGVDDVGTADTLVTVKVVVGAGYYGAESAQSTTVFDSWNVCP